MYVCVYTNAHDALSHTLARARSLSGKCFVYDLTCVPQVIMSSASPPTASSSTAGAQTSGPASSSAPNGPHSSHHSSFHGTLPPLDLISAPDISTRHVAFLDHAGSMLATAGAGAPAHKPAPGTKPSSIRIWDLLRPAGHSCVAVLAPHDVGCCALLPVSTRGLLVSGGMRGDMCVSRFGTWQTLLRVEAHKGPLTALVMAPERSGVSAGGSAYDGDGTRTSSAEAGSPSAATSSMLDGFVSAGSDGQVRVWGLDFLLQSGGEAGYSGYAANMSNNSFSHGEAADGKEAHAALRALSHAAAGVGASISVGAGGLGGGGITGMAATGDALFVVADGGLVRRPWVLAPAQP